ncbi:MAG TPA: hypothetical protein VFJ43_07235, partial [Bacteroidia bacterium]|nr:hypothetical protein [Bacteroidia bacterium]
MRPTLKIFLLSIFLACVFFARQDVANGTPKRILVDEKPKLSTHNPLMPDPDQLFDFAKVNVDVIKSAGTYSENKVTMLLSAIGGVDDAKRNFSNTMMPLDEIYNTLQKQSSVYELISQTTTDKAIRDSASSMMSKFNSLTDELMQNEPLYKAIKSYSETAEAKALTGERAYFVKHLLLEFSLNGMSLSVSDRDTLKMLNAKINELSAAFGKNISGDKTMITFKKSELNGLAKDFVDDHQNPDKSDSYQFDLSLPTYISFMADCGNADARKKMYIGRMNIGGEANEKLLVDIVRLRTRKAKL